MYPKKLLRSSAFRLALGYVALFAVSAVLLLAFIYWSTASYMQRQADETIEAEIVGLDERYRLTGLSGLTASIRERLSRRPVGSSIYLLTDRLYTPIVGNLDRWPAAEVDAEGWMTFELTVMPDEPKHEVRAKPFALPQGFRLLVGRDMYELQAMRSRLVLTLGWGLALTVGLALAGGVVMSRSRVRRIGVINDAIGAVMGGDLSRRIPTDSSRGGGGEIEELVVRLNRMLDELEQLVEGVRRVSDSIAHDLRTPLARLKTRLERLRQSGAGEEAERAAEEADELLATFAALLRIARIESGEARSQFGTVDLTALIDDAAELYRPLIEERGKKFVIHNAPEVSVQGDRDMLFQAVANLLDNALKHTPSPGRIELSMGTTNRSVHIVVADDGEGIPIDERDNVLGRFYRLDSSRTTTGSGLGLSLVAAVVNLHQGDLRFEDNDPGLRVVVELQRPD